MNEQETLAFLRDRHRTVGMRLGTENVRRALALWNNPQDRLRAVHVAGTNGKGSVSTLLRGALSAAGFCTGQFLSPAPTGVYDTITLDGRPIPPAVFAALVSEICTVCEEAGLTLSEFEIQTVLMFLYLTRERCDIAVIECGMGGKDDATNVMAKPLLCVFTAISRDHTAFLGDTPAAIARQKAGILRPGCDAVSVPDQPDEVLTVLFEEAAAVGATLHLPGGLPQEVTLTLTETRFSLAGTDYILSLPGRHQIANAQAALLALQVLAKKGFVVPPAAIHRGFTTASLPCRQEVLSRSPLRLLDGAHNPQGVAALADTLRTQGLTDGTLLFGMLRDKDTAASVAQIAPCCRQVVCVAPENERALSAAALAAQFEAAGTPAVTAADLPKALCTALTLAGDGPLVIGGSFYVAGPLRRLLIGEAGGQAI